MNILLIGSGGREHALSWKISQSSQLNNLFIAPGNPGTALHGKNVNIAIDDFEELGTFVLENKINYVVVGPEVPLVNGLHDFFHADPKMSHVTIVGPDKAAAMLEGSKKFAKDFMKRHNIPTAAYGTFTRKTLQEGINFLATLKPPYVLKADGLAAGKGVLIVDELSEAISVLEEILNGKFGNAGNTVVIEEFLQGTELSVFIIADGTSFKLLPEAKDYKRIGDGDTGLNTGGMGAVSPVPAATPEFLEKVVMHVINPTLRGLVADGIHYQGFLFFGLMNVKGDPIVIEYNVRLGDPETEAILPRIKSDIIELFEGIATGTLSERDVDIDPRTTVTVMGVSEGYPEKYEKGKPITGLGLVDSSIVFHAGTIDNNGTLVTNGGRVLAVTSYGKNLEQAIERSYQSMGKLEFEGLYYRKDIGQDLIKKPVLKKVKS